MLKRSLIFSVGLVVSITLKPILTTGQLSAAQQSEEKKRSPQKKKAEATKPKPPEDIRGTDKSPLIVQVQPTQKSQQETANEQKQREQEATNTRLNIRINEILAFVAFLQLIVFGIQAWMLKRTIQKMDEVATDQTTDMRNSIAQLTRSAIAMEGIAQSMAASIEINREIADRQKLVTELSGRAYLSINLETAIYQDAMHVFEAIAVITNRGSTPAYDVTFRTAAAILPFPIPDDFHFAIPQANRGTSVSMIASGLNKILRRVVPDRVPDDEVERIKWGGLNKHLAMWGVVNYKDAFGESRYTNFAFSIYWAGKLPNGADNIMSIDTSRHNDSN